MSAPTQGESARQASIDLGWIERFVFRPAFILLTLLLVVFAIFQAAGRIATSLAPQFEDQLNLALGTQRIKVVGLQGDWQGLNPVLRIDNLVIPAGSVSNLYVELDVIESIWRSAPIMRVLEADDITLVAEQTDAGWRLLGQQEQANELDIVDTIWHSDRLTAAGKLALVAMSGETQVIEFNLQAGNHSRAHYIAANVAHAVGSPPESQDSDGLQLQLWRNDGLQFFDRVVVAPQSMAISLNGGLSIPSVLVNMPDLKLELQPSLWRESAGEGFGKIQLRAMGIRVPGSDADLSLELDADLRRDGELFSGFAPVLQITGGKRVRLPDDAALASLAAGAAAYQLPIGPVHMALDTSEPAPLANLARAVDAIVDDARPEVADPLLRFWLERLDLAAVTAFIDTQMGEWEPAGRWVRALALQGFADNLHVYFDPDFGLGYASSISDLHMQGYKGAPMLLNGQGQVWGYEHGIAMQIDATDATVQFPDLYHNAWAMDEIQGLVKAWFEPGYFGLRGSQLHARMANTLVAGGFAVTRPDPRHEQRVSLQLSIDEVDMARGLTFIPFKIPEALSNWLATGPRSGTLSAAQFAYHGQVHTRPDELGRRVELLTDLQDASVSYDTRWPLMEQVTGQVHAAGPLIRVRVDSAQTLGVGINNTTVLLHDNARYADIAMRASGDGARFLDFIRFSPLAENLSFIKPDWESTGELSIDGTLLVPIKGEVEAEIASEPVPELAVEFSYSFVDADLTMPDFRVALSDMRGGGTYQLPHQLMGDITATLFDAPATINVSSDDDWVRIAVTGQTSPQDVYDMIKFTGEFPVAGKIAFDSVLSIAMRKSLISNMSVTTNLTGLQVNLPGQFGKQALVAAPSEFDIQFLPRYQSVRWRSLGTRGWLHYGDQVERGAIGIASDPPMTAQNERAILISGSMPLVRLSDWVSDQGDASVSLPLDWTIKDLRIGRFFIDELNFADIKLNGSQRGSAVEFQFAAPDLRGQLRMSDSAVMDLDLAHLRIPQTDVALDPIDAPAADPLSVEVGYSLPAATVKIDQLQLGDSPFGAWQFEIQPDFQPQVRQADDAVRFVNFNADVNGVHIKDGVVRWDLVRNVAGFKGDITLDDLAETLPMWDYAPSLQTSEAVMSIDAQWAGSPVNVSLFGLDGRLDFIAKNGQFLEVETGNSGLRIMSLLNFSNIARRISFDFSDVTSEGITFDKIEASVKLKQGRLDILDRMTVESSSSNFEVGGSVDLVSGQLNNEMIVTLPVSNSLPWYGVYLALANPLAGLGVLVGERVFRKPLQQMSSAKFSVKGTLDEPEVNFVSLFDRSLASGANTAGTSVEGQEAEAQQLDKPVNPSGR